MTIYSQIYINGSVEWLDIPAPFCDTGMAWNDKLLVTEACWGDGVRVRDWAWGNQPIDLIGVDIPWHGVVLVCLS